MSAEEDWAKIIEVKSKLTDNSAGAVLRSDAPARVQRLTGNTILCGAPTEYFSDRLVRHSTGVSEDGNQPIEDLYGRYDPKTRKIEIFLARISQDYTRFAASLSDFLSVIRIHEHAHAVVHIGIYEADLVRELGTVDATGLTDWQTFLKRRDNEFGTIDEGSHELLAQAITWACVSQAPEDNQLAETFVALQERQAARYQFPSNVKRRASSADWPLVLKAARGEIQADRDLPFCLKDALAILIGRDERNEISPQAGVPEVLLEFLVEAQQALATADVANQTSSSLQPDRPLELLLARKHEIELRMYKEQAHRRPHFHVEYKKEFSASYALDTFEVLAGFMPKRYEAVILPIARRKRGELVATWETLNGPVTLNLPAPYAERNHS